MTALFPSPSTTSGQCLLQTGAAGFHRAAMVEIHDEAFLGPQVPNSRPNQDAGRSPDAGAVLADLIVELRAAHPGTAAVAASPCPTAKAAGRHRGRWSHR